MSIKCKYKYIGWVNNFIGPVARRIFLILKNKLKSKLKSFAMTLKSEEAFKYYFLCSRRRQKIYYAIFFKCSLFVFDKSISRK